MRYAISHIGERVVALPKENAICPSCNSEVVSKCGKIVAWHWAHKAVECDEWAEPDTEWHRAWQNRFFVHQREVVIGPHRADIVADNGQVIELQHSSIGIDEIRQREMFYKHMTWIFDANDAYAKHRLEVRTPKNKDYVTFRWKHPRKSIAYCQCPTFLDLGDGRLLRVHKIYINAPCGGWGRIVPVDYFVQQNISKEDHA